MRDGDGYLNDVKRHIHVFDIATKADVQLTSDRYDDGAPAWAPDGSLIAFSANRTRQPGRERQQRHLRHRAARRREARAG